jgi:hypothetical protein
MDICYRMLSNFTPQPACNSKNRQADHHRENPYLFRMPFLALCLQTLLLTLVGLNINALFCPASEALMS